MGDMINDIHDGPCSMAHFCEYHCSMRFESEAPMGCDCPYEDDMQECEP